MTEGLIVKANSGFYYVCVGSEHSEIVECHARGIFRKKHFSPLVGDRVMISQNGAAGQIEQILPRKNSLARPPVANIDTLFIVVSTTQPKPNLYVIDSLTVMARQKGIEPVIIVSKTDLKSGQEIIDIYNKAGFICFAASGVTGEGIDRLKELIAGKTGAFTGNTGVGKSTILNRLDPTLSCATGEISEKLGRGRHTTRIVELYNVCGGWIADTPGFAAFNAEGSEPVLKEDLQYMFKEFAPYLDGCRYTGCSHIKESGCAVLKAVENGEIPRSRHDSYCKMYEEAKHIKEWELKKRKDV
jgi:ribosome biogenesis GTPase